SRNCGVSRVSLDRDLLAFDFGKGLVARVAIAFSRKKCAGFIRVGFLCSLYCGSDSFGKLWNIGFTDRSHGNGLAIWFERYRLNSGQIFLRLTALLCISFVWLHSFFPEWWRRFWLWPQAVELRRR